MASGESPYAASAAVVTGRSRSATSGVGRLRQVVQSLGPGHDTLPSTASSTRVISSRARTTDAVGPLM